MRLALLILAVLPIQAQRVSARIPDGTSMVAARKGDDWVLLSGTRRAMERTDYDWIIPASHILLDGGLYVACLGGYADATTPRTWGEGWDGPGQGAARLTYYLARTDRTTRRAWLTALWQWEAVVDVRVRRAKTPGLERSIDVSWVAREHGDGFPFYQGQYAHSFYPVPNPEPIAGDIHLWETATADTYSLLIHEIGHALGLTHSDDPESVMYPFYRLLNRLAASDIAAVRMIYAEVR